MSEEQGKQYVGVVYYGDEDMFGHYKEFRSRKVYNSLEEATKWAKRRFLIQEKSIRALVYELGVTPIAIAMVKERRAK